MAARPFVTILGATLVLALAGCGGEVSLVGAPGAATGATAPIQNYTPAIANSASVAPSTGPVGQFALSISGLQSIPHSHLLFWKKIELKGEVVNASNVPQSTLVQFVWTYANTTATKSLAVSVPPDGSTPFDVTSDGAADSGTAQLLPLDMQGGYPQGSNGQVTYGPGSAGNGYSQSGYPQAGSSVY